MYNWRERAAAYDAACSLIVIDTVALALETLRDASVEAAEALIEALQNPKTKVQAAKEILNRIGIPATERRETVSVRVTADDIKRAREEATEWESTTFETNG